MPSRDCRCGRYALLNGISYVYNHDDGRTHRRGYCTKGRTALTDGRVGPVMQVLEADPATVTLKRAAWAFLTSRKGSDVEQRALDLLERKIAEARRG